MIYFLNSNGDTTIVKSEYVYQGSINANSIVVVAPITPTAQPSASFILPNGLHVAGGLMTRLVDTTQIFEDKQGQIYNAWSLDLDFPVTQYSGTVRVQFDFALGSGKLLASYETQFEVSKGVATDFPTYSAIANAEQIFNDIRNYLASISEDTQEALDKAILYARYITKDEYLINKKDASYIGLSVVPSNGELNANCNFTVAGMTDYLTQSQIVNPTLGENANDLFFQLKTDVGLGQGGFLIDLGTEQSIGIVQMYAWSIWEKLYMKAYIKGEEGNYTRVDEVTFPSTAGANTLDIFRFNINKTARYIKIVQEDSNYTNGSYACKGIEIFKPNIDGYYQIVQSNGNVIELDTFNAQKLVDEITAFKDETQGYAEDAQTSAEDAASALTQITNKAGKPGGYPILQDIGGKTVIPSQYINITTGVVYVDITSEEELNDLNVTAGTVARLVVDADGNENAYQQVVKSFVKLVDGGWAIYGSSYADNAGNALYSQEATNTLRINGTIINKLTQAQYDALVDKTGVYFVTIGE